MGDFDSKLDFLMKNKTEGGSNVKLTKEFKRALIRQKIIQTVLVIIMAILVFGAGWISYFGPVRTPNGMEYPKRKSVLVGDKVIASDNKDTITARFVEALTIEPSMIEGEVIAGPSGSFYGDSGDITVMSINDRSEVKTNIVLDGKNADKTKLDGEYVVRCTIDYCKKGKDYIIPSNKMKGVLLTPEQEKQQKEVKK